MRIDALMYCVLLVYLLTTDEPASQNILFEGNEVGGGQPLDRQGGKM